MSGFWIPTLFLLLPSSRAKSLVFVATLIFWIGHRISSLYLGFCVGEYREVLRARKRYFFTLPFLLFCLLAIFLSLPETLIPLS
ncbi:MAG TPA: hypothetical protein VFW62_00125, partial [bacterium]|nr:hypothetical protein [bacterium]